MKTTSVPFHRIAKALSSLGIIARREGDVVYVESLRDPRIRARILIPETLPLEARAVEQLLAFAAVAHPAGGEVLQTCATPDFHPGVTVPVGSVLVTSDDFVVPQAIGTDIACGMRLHVVDLPLARFQERKHELVSLLKGDLLESTRNVPTTPQAMTALFAEGLPAFWRAMQTHRQGIFAQLDFSQVRHEAEQLTGRHPGKPEYAPEHLCDPKRGTLRDPGLATLGSGNHFCEIQQVAEILDRHAAYRLGVRQGQLAVMIHSGSRDVGRYVGQRWADKAKAAWPRHLKYPENGLFGLAGPAADEYLFAMHAAAHYADANRALIAELVRQRLRQVHGSLEMPLVCDIQHNIALREDAGIVHRKGATPAHPGQPLLIPGSMGDYSYLVEGLGNPGFASSASHGAGRAVARAAMAHKREEEEPRAFECITLREQRRIEEAPVAYKPVAPVIQSQIDNGLIKPVAKLAPILTFKA